VNDPNVIKDAIAHLRRYPEMHLGRPEATRAQLASFLVSDALNLGAQHCSCSVLSQWTIVSAEVDWTRRGRGGDRPYAELFRILVPLPEAGLEEIRHEIYLRAFAADVFVASRQAIEVIQGAPPPADVAALLTEQPFSIGFRMADPRR
jgi:hypothetical protein